MEDNKKIQVTVVRNDKSRQEKDAKSGLYIETPLPHYDIKRVVGAAQVLIDGDRGEKIRAYIVGAQISHDELVKLAAYKEYEVTVLDASAAR